jgi:hypothetical protein
MSMNPIRLNHIAFSYTGKMLSGIECLQSSHKQYDAIDADTVEME